MPQPGDVCPGFMADAGRCWRVVYDRNLPGGCDEGLGRGRIERGPEGVPVRRAGVMPAAARRSSVGAMVRKAGPSDEDYDSAARLGLLGLTAGEDADVDPHGTAGWLAPSQQHLPG